MVHPELNPVTKEPHPLWLLIFYLRMCVCVCETSCQLSSSAIFGFSCTLCSSFFLHCLSEMKTYEDSPSRAQYGCGSAIKNLEVKRTLRYFTHVPSTTHTDTQNVQVDRSNV